MRLRTGFGKLLRLDLLSIAAATAIILGFILRIAGIGFGIDPVSGQVHAWHPDEVEWVAGSLLTDLDGMNTHYHYYGSGHIYLLFLVNRILFYLARITGVADGMTYPSFIHTSGIERQLTARFLSVLFSMGTLVLIYMTGKFVFSRRTALLSTILLSLNPISVIHAHYATVDSAFMFWLLAAYLIYFKIYKNGKTRNNKSTSTPSMKIILYAGILTGTAIGTKYNAGTLVFMIGAIIFINRGIRLKDIIILASVTGLIFLILNPYDLLDFQSFKRQLAFNINIDGAFRADSGFYMGYVDYLSNRILGKYIGSWILIASLIGILCTIFFKPADTLVLLAHPLVYFLIVGSFAERTPRHMMPILPIIILFAAEALNRTYLFVRDFTGQIPGAFITAVFLIVMVSSPTTLALSRTSLMVKKDTRTAAENWVIKNIPVGASVVVDRNGEYSPYLSPGRYKIGKHDFKPGDDVTSFNDVLNGGYEWFIASELMYMVNYDRDQSGLYFDLANDRHSKLAAVFRGVDQTFNFHHPTIRIYHIFKDDTSVP